MNILTKSEECILNNAKKEFQDACIGKALLMDPAGSKQLQEQASCVKTRIDSFRSATFVVTCVGMLKSGKSTLVNLFARNPLASPTGYGFDTTLRPALIMETDMPTGEIEIWFPKRNAKKSNFEILFNHLRGVDNTEKIEEEFSLHKEPLTEEKLTNALCKKARETEDNLLPSEPALVVVKVPHHEKSLLSSDIMILDTPGLDSGLSEWTKKSEQNSYSYSWIINNSDLLLFLQSSVAPLNQMATDILKAIQDNQAIVWLVHNEMVSKPWLTPETTKKIAEKQRQRASEMFSHIQVRFGFDQFNANLGKASSASFERSVLLPSERHEKLLNESQFPTMEERITKDLKDRIAPIRRINCKNKLQKELEEMEAEVTKIRQRANDEKKKIHHEIEKMEKLKKEVKDWLSNLPQQQSLTVGQGFADIKLSSSNPFKKEDLIQCLLQHYECDFDSERFSRTKVQEIIKNTRKSLFDKIKKALEEMTINHFYLSLEAGTNRQNDIAKFMKQKFIQFIKNIVKINYPQHFDGNSEELLQLIEQIGRQIDFPDVSQVFHVHLDDRSVPVDVDEEHPVLKVLLLGLRDNWTRKEAQTAFWDFFDPEKKTGKFIAYIDKIETGIRTNLHSWLNTDFYEKMRDALIEDLEAKIKEKITKKEKDIDNWEKDATTLGQMLNGCQNLEKIIKEEF